MRRPHGPATARRQKIVVLLGELLAIKPADRPKRFDPAKVVAAKVKVKRRTVMAVARAFGLELPRLVSPQHRLAFVDQAQFLREFMLMGAAKLSRKHRCSVQAVYEKAKALRGQPLAP